MTDQLRFPPVIALGHQARCGKGTIAEYLAATHGYQILRFADRLRECAVLVTGLPMRRFVEDKMLPNPEWGGKTGAEILQGVGKGMRDGVHVDVWAKVVVGFILRSSDTVRWVIEDLRYPSEVAALLDARGPLLLWKVTRPDDQRGDIGRPKGHESETALATYDGWDSVLTNDGSIAELHVAVEMALTLWRARS